MGWSWSNKSSEQKASIEFDITQEKNEHKNSSQLDEQ